MDKDSSIQVDITDYIDCVHIKLSGQIRMDNIGDLTSIVWGFFEGYTTNVLILDAFKLVSIDSMGLATLICLHKKIAPLFIYGLNEHIFTLIDRVGLTKVFHVYKNEEDVRASKEFRKMVLKIPK